MVWHIRKVGRGFGLRIMTPRGSAWRGLAADGWALRVAVPGSGPFVLIETSDAGLDVAHNPAQFGEIACLEVGLEPLKQRFHRRAVPLHQAGDVAFVNCYAAFPEQGEQVHDVAVGG